MKKKVTDEKISTLQSFVAELGTPVLGMPVEIFSDFEFFENFFKIV